MSPGPLPDTATLGRTVARLLEDLAHFSAPGRGVTRLYLSAQHRDALGLL